MRDRFFSEHRDKDYHLPRSMREAYGYEATLYVEEPYTDGGGWFLAIGVVGVLIWFGYGWI